jgi:hypothetical protein
MLIIGDVMTWLARVRLRGAIADRTPTQSQLPAPNPAVRTALEQIAPTATNPTEPVTNIRGARRRARGWRRRVLLHKGEQLHVAMVKRADRGWLTMLDTEGMVVLCYDATSPDATYAHVLDRHVAQFYAPQSLADVLARDHLRAAEAVSCSQHAGWRCCPNGTIFWAVTTIEPMLLRDGRIQGFAHVIRAADGPAANSGAPGAGNLVKQLVSRSGAM